MNPELKNYYDHALNILETNDAYINGYVTECKKAIRMMGDEIIRMENILHDIKSELKEYHEEEFEVTDNEVCVNTALDFVEEALNGPKKKDDVEVPE